VAVNSINVPMHLTLSIRALFLSLSYIHEHFVVRFIITHLDFLAKISEHNEILLIYTKNDLSEGVTRTEQKSVGRHQLCSICRTMSNIHKTTERKCEKFYL
jgi:hypothetical protein